MTHDEALRLWAYQWVMRGEIPDLPEDVRLYVAHNSTGFVAVPIGMLTGLSLEHITLRKFVLESADTIRTCRAGYGERTKTFVVTPVETHSRYDLATAEPELPP